MRSAIITRSRAVLAAVRSNNEAGLATVEYAIATIAAAGFAGLLIVVLKSGKVQTMLTDIIQSALHVG